MRPFAWNRTAFGLIFLITIPLASSQEVPSSTTVRSAGEGLRARDVGSRRAAANQLRLAPRDIQRDSLPILIELLMTEKDGQVRLAVLDTVTALGADAEAAVPALLHTLRTNSGGQGLEESHQDYRSALALAAIGKPATEGLIGLLKEKKESVRAEVVMALGRIGPDASVAVPALIPLLGDSSARVRREVSRALGRIGPSSIEPLIVAANDRDVLVRSGAVEALGGLPARHERVVRIQIEATRDGSPQVRAAAVGSLARLRLSESVLIPIVLENLRHDDERVRRAVVALLSDDRALLTRLASELESLLTAENAGVARHAAFLLAKSGSSAAPRMINALRHEGCRVDAIADALVLIGRPGVDILRASLRDHEPRVRRGAALALGKIRPLASGVVDELTVTLADPDPSVRMAGLSAIGSLGSRAADSIPAVRALLRDGSPELRRLAIEVLSSSAPRDERLLSDLTPLIDDVDPKVVAGAIDAIRNLGPAGRTVLAPVITRLESENSDVRFAAAQMVESQGPAAVAAIAPLTRLLMDEFPRNRAIAAVTLGKFGKPAQPAFAALTTRLDDHDAAVREAAATAIGSLEIDAETVRPHLAKALRDDRTEVRRAAGRGVARLGPQGVILVPDIIAMAARKENLRSVDRLLKPFERTGPDARSLPELLKLLEHDQVGVRLLAIKFLGLAGKNAAEALPALERIREDPSAEIRLQVKSACEQIKKDAEPASGKPTS